MPLFLDELHPDRGRYPTGVMPECGIFCEIEFMNLNSITKKLLNYLCNNNNVIIFVESTNKSNMSEKPISKKRQKKEKELLFFLRYYKELKSRGHYQIELDYQIEQLMTKLKEMD